MSLVVGIGAFGAGAWLLVASVDGLIKTLRAWALGAGLSGNGQRSRLMLRMAIEDRR